MPAEPAAPPAVDRTIRRPYGSSARRRVALAAVLPALYLPGTMHNFFDLKIYMAAMDWWAAGNPLYDYAQPDRVQGELFFTYPPFAALLLRPFAWLPLGATVTIFTVLTLLARGGHHQVAAGPADPSAPPAAPVHRSSWRCCWCSRVESTRETITFGQINMLLVVLILADLLFAVPRDSRWAGVGVGLATALKLFPGIFIVYLLATRRWRAAVVAEATAAGATLLAAAVAPGDSWRFWTHELWADRPGRPHRLHRQPVAVRPAQPLHRPGGAEPAALAAAGRGRRRVRPVAGRPGARRPGTRSPA